MNKRIRDEDHIAVRSFFSIYLNPHNLNEVERREAQYQSHWTVRRTEFLTFEDGLSCPHFVCGYIHNNLNVKELI